MNSNEWKKVDELVQAALEIAPEEREDFLTKVCAGDNALRQQIESLLILDLQATEFLEVPAFEFGATLILHEEQSLVGRRLGHYELQRKIGSGGMGEVYLAKDTTLERTVALKVLPAEVASDSERLRRFTREAKAASALNHPNIITVHEIGNFESTLFIVTEFVDGVTLREKLKESGMPLGEVLEVIRQIAAALVAAHEVGIVHRDIKPENIMLRRDGYVKVLDFGLVKLTERPGLVVDRDATTQSLIRTDPNTIIGTVHYMSPEQARGLAIDARTDIWSLGVVFYELTTGRRPFEGASATDVIISLAEKEPAPLQLYSPNVPAEMERIIRKMLEKEKKSRYQTVQEFLNDLNNFQQGLASEIAWTQLVSREKPDRPAGSPTISDQAPEKMSTKTLEKQIFSVDYLLSQAKLHKAAVSITLVLLTITVVVFLLFFRTGGAGIPENSARSLVVLPCKVYGAEEMSYLADAVPSTLSTLLGEVDGLETKVPPTSFEVDQVHGDLDKIATAYKVNTFVMTTMTVDLEKMLLNVQLVEAQSRRLVWGREFQGERADYIVLLRQAAEGIRQTIASSVSQKPLGGVSANSEAELAFRQGKYHSKRYNNLHHASDFDIALSSFKRALEHDPGLANAAAEIANLYMFRLDAGAPSSEVTMNIVNWAEQALRIDPKCARAFVALSFTEETHSPESYYKMLGYALRASHLDGRDAMAQTALGGTLDHVSLELGLEAARESQRLDPLYLHPHLNVASHLYYLGRTTEGLSHIEHALQIEPEMPFALWIKALMLADINRSQEATELVKRLERMVAEERFPANLYLIGQHNAALSGGDLRTAQSDLKRILDIVEGPNAASYEREFFMANVVPSLARHGKTEESLNLLLQCVKAGVLPPYDWLLLNPNLALIRSDARFKRLLTRSKTDFEQTIRLLKEAKSRQELPAYVDRSVSDLLRKLDLAQGI